jgi:hypothetical protein
MVCKLLEDKWTDCSWRWNKIIQQKTEHTVESKCPTKFSSELECITLTAVNSNVSDSVIDWNIHKIHIFKFYFYIIIIVVDWKVVQLHELSRPQSELCSGDLIVAGRWWGSAQGGAQGTQAGDGGLGGVRAVEPCPCALWRRGRDRKRGRWLIDHSLLSTCHWDLGYDNNGIKIDFMIMYTRICMYVCVYMCQSL